MTDADSAESRNDPQAAEDIGNRRAAAKVRREPRNAEVMLEVHCGPSRIRRRDVGPLAERVAGPGARDQRSTPGAGREAQ